MKRLDALLLVKLLLANRVDISGYSHEDILMAAERVVEERPYWTICNRHVHTWTRAVTAELYRMNAEQRSDRYLSFEDRHRKLTGEFGKHYGELLDLPISIDAGHAFTVGNVYLGDFKIGPRTTRFKDQRGLAATIALVVGALKKFEVSNPQFVIETEKRARKYATMPSETVEVFVRENLQDNTRAPGR